MRRKHIILLYLFVIAIVTNAYLTVSFSYTQPNETITQYIIALSRDIQNSLQKPDRDILEDSKGELKLKLLLSPWGELKDAYVSDSSGNAELDNLCVRAVWNYERYQPFPEDLGDDDLWIDVPIIFAVAAELALPLPPVAPLEISVAPYMNSKISNGATDGGLSINEAVDIGLENNMTAKIAEEEIELSNLKIREARRALYPAASLNYLETTGKTTGTAQDFTDKEYKLKFEYPLYYGWRLKYAVDQAISNRNASTYNYDKALQDMRVEVEVAFYAYIASKINLKLQHSLSSEIEKIYEIARKRHGRGLSTKSEFLQAQSQLKQVNYQVASSENDISLAKLTLAQAMNVNAEDVEGLLDIDTDVDIEPIDVDVSLEDCLDLAFIYRPDLKAKEYMIEFNDYGRKIEQSKDQFKVDLIGTYGKSGGAFESESLVMGSDWYFGLKVSKPLGGNTLSTAYTEDKTSQKHGVSTRTESVSQSVELGLLDNLQSFSEKKSATIALKKAEDEFHNTRDAVLKEVKESYLSFKKALIQIDTSLNKIKYREEELKIAKARAELNEIPLSDLIQAHVSLTDEKLFYIEAVGNSYQSLAKLNKATGYALFLDNESFKVADVMKP